MAKRNGRRGSLPTQFSAVLLLAVVVLPTDGLATRPDWVRRYNGTGNASDEVTAMAAGADGSICVTGRSIGADGDFDYVTIKYASDGSKLWARRLDGIGGQYDVPNAIAVDAAGNVYVTGASAGRDDPSGAALDFLTVKYAADGRLAWIRRYNGSGDSYDAAWDIAVDQAGSVYVTGVSTPAGTIFGNYTTIKYASDGKFLWIRFYDGPARHDDHAYALALDAAGDAYVTGGSSNGSTTDYLTVKYAANGQRLWARRYDGVSRFIDRAEDIAVDSAGNVCVVGVSWNSGSRSYDYATLKYSTGGELQWVRRYEGPAKADDIAEKVAFDGSGNCYVTGWSMGAISGYDFATLKYDPLGRLLWLRRYNGPANGYDHALGLAVDGDGNACVTGPSATSSSGSDYVTVQYDALGKVVWMGRYDGPCHSNDSAASVVMAPSGHVYVSGDSYCPSTGSDFATLRYSP